MMARRKKPNDKSKSKGYNKARLQTAKIYAKVARKRKVDARKCAKCIVRNYDQTAVDDFSPKFLAQSTMARKAVGWADCSGKAGTYLDGCKT